ncbi:MAG: MliC family protein [Alphaproteobacteria bacterium]|nr:MliC family protein [Alphaproteobacteria bacterium]
MRKYIIALSVLALAACGDKASDKIEMKCGVFKVVAHVSPNNIKATVGGRDFTLVNTVSASGARYDSVDSDIKVTLWSKGDQWILIVNDDDVSECVSVAAKKSE